jgi:hypothetical protein
MASGLILGTGAKAVYQVNIGWLANNQHCQTGFAVRDVAFNDNTAQGVLDVIDPFANGLFKGLLLDSDRLLFLDVARLFSEDSAHKDYVNVPGTNGSGQATYLPTFLSMKIAMKRQARKRYGQGRMFWPIRQDTWVDADTLTAGAITAVNSIIQWLTDNLTGVTADLHLCNYHMVIPARPAKGSTPAREEIPPTWYDVDTIVLATDATAVKSRKVGRGA